MEALPKMLFPCTDFPCRVDWIEEFEIMGGIQFLTDEKGRKVGVLIDLKKHGAIWQDFWDGLVSESRRKEKSVPYGQYRAARLKRSRSRV
jgi:hypothetical protein